MAAPVPLRSDFTADGLRCEARRTDDANQARRLLALAAIYDGGSRGEAARIGGVGLQVVRDWVVRFNAEGPAGLIDRKPPGAAPKLNADQRRALVRVVESGPNPAVDGVVRWRVADLVQWVWEEFGISVCRQTLGRVLRQLGYRRLSARPRHHRQDPEALEAFKKNSRRRWRRSGSASARPSA